MTTWSTTSGLCWTTDRRFALTGNAASSNSRFDGRVMMLPTIPGSRGPASGRTKSCTHTCVRTGWYASSPHSTHNPTPRAEAVEAAEEAYVRFQNGSNSHTPKFFFLQQQLFFFNFFFRKLKELQFFRDSRSYNLWCCYVCVGDFMVVEL